MTGVEFLTVAEVAERLRIPVATLRDWRVDGKGPAAFKFEGQVRYSAADLDAWIEACRVGPTPRLRSTA
jgi:excisionase family DNA binding protein